MRGLPGGDERRWYVDEALLALELSALASFAFSRTVLDTFGRSPESFLVRGATAATVVEFGLVVALVPALAVAMAGLATRPLGGRVRGWVHVGLVALVGGLAAWQLAQSVTGDPPDSLTVRIGAVLGAAMLAVACRRWPAARTFLRFIGLASVIFLVQFLVLSPASRLVTGEPVGADAEVASGVAADLGDDPPDVVLVVFDALPTFSLLDGTGHIDAEAYPNFARLAATSTWYRNHTTLSPFTVFAVPTILTGRSPDPGAAAFPPPDPKNIFTLLGGSYDVTAQEWVTRLCPRETCPVDDSSALRHLLGDAVDLWATSDQSDTAPPREFDMAAIARDDRYAEAERFIHGFDPGGRVPDLYVHHLVLPHGPWQLTDDGTIYHSRDNESPTGTAFVGFGGVGYHVGLQRHVLQTQAADRLLGRLLDRLDEAGTLDDSLVVVTADHGQSFMPGEPGRQVSEANYPDIMWSPLLVKEPGQETGRVDDADVRSVDILPTIADVLGIEIPWEVDGIPVTQASRRQGDVKPLANSQNNFLRADDPDLPFVEVDARAGLARVLASDAIEWSGPGAAWRRTVHGDLVGREVDDLEVGGPAGGSIDMPDLDRFDDVDTGAPLDIELVGLTDLEE
ncbi:MAG TPA: sulfatase-like hydrolase/transferase, partial [Acidimicrobiales bacterium]